MPAVRTPNVFVSAAATGVGKSYISRALARSATRLGATVAALKPLETGVAPDPLDALALARAAGRLELANVPGFFRATPPLAPYAAALEAQQSPPDLDALAASVRRAALGSDVLIVEGAGGLLVPVDRRRTIADLVRALGLPLILVARDELGVLSSLLTCVESALARELTVAAVILSQHSAQPDDPSPRTNRRILQERLACPVLHFPRCADDDDALADAADAIGLAAALQRSIAR